VFSLTAWLAIMYRELVLVQKLKNKSLILFVGINNLSILALVFILPLYCWHKYECSLSLVEYVKASN